MPPNQSKGTNPDSIAAIVQNFKSFSTRRINQIQTNIIGCTLWQRNDYEQIVQDNAALKNIQDYIRKNPLIWQQDPLHPNHPSRDY